MPQNIIINAHTIIPHTGPDIVWLLHPKIVPINATIIPMETTNVIVVYVFTISDNMKTININTNNPTANHFAFENDLSTCPYPFCYSSFLL